MTCRRCNRTIIVKGKVANLIIPEEVFVVTQAAARFLAAFLCLGDGPVRLYGIERMHERPQSELFQALRMLGYHGRMMTNCQQLFMESVRVGLHVR